ncbi:MAG: Zn-ribbon domain-containing OB-fold protein [Thermodesulfobacteriota bacterium]
MSDWLSQTEEMVHSGRIKVPYTWWVGETGSHFFISLRDHKKILGSFCPACAKVFIPPRKVCGRCFHQQLEWREVGPAGTLLTYTVPRFREAIHPRPPGFAYGIIKLDGADTGLTHLLGEYADGQLKRGLRVTAVFKEERAGNIMDILYFKPVE